MNCWNIVRDGSLWASVKEADYMGGCWGQFFSKVHGIFWGTIFSKASKGFRLTLLALKEALARVGGSQVALDQGVRAGRIIRTQTPGSMPMFFFPRKEYSKDSVYKQMIGGGSEKASSNLADLNLVEPDKLGFHWDPKDIVGLNMEGMQPTDLFSKATSSATMSSSSASPVLPMPIGSGSSGAMCSWINLGTMESFLEVPNGGLCGIVVWGGLLGISGKVFLFYCSLHLES